MRNYGDLKVVVSFQMHRYGIEIWVMSNTPEYAINYNFVDGEIIETKVTNEFVQKEDIKPFLVLPKMFADFFIKGLVEYANTNNIKTKDQTLIEGKLIATELHLKDMQEITKKLIDFTITPTAIKSY